METKIKNGFNFSEGTVTALPDSVCYNCKSLEVVITNDLVQSIGNFAFYGCQKLSRFSKSASGKVVIPSACTSIGNYAFSHNYLLGANGVEVNEGVTTIGCRVFRYLKDARNFTLPSTLLTMDSGCFTGNATYPIQIDCLTCNAVTPPEIICTLSGKTACLTENTSYCTITAIKVPAASVDAYKAADGWSQFASVISAIE